MLNNIKLSIIEIMMKRVKKIAQQVIMRRLKQTENLYINNYYYF